MATHQDLLGRIKQLGGLQTTREATAALRATLAALGERLSDRDRDLVAGVLPRSVAGALHKGKRRGAFDIAELYNRIRRREGVTLGFAREHAQVVCRVLGEILPDVARREIERALPESFAELFSPPRSFDPPPEHPVAPGAQHRTLATGRAGSLHPLSESRPRAAQSHSVVSESNPHADTKLSSASGLTQERLDESLATARQAMLRT
jgi:uncharacterized protein (DUF2267 family)